MSLTSMMRSSLGIAPSMPAPSFLQGEIVRKGAIVGGAAVSGYINGRFASPGKDYLEIQLPKWLGGAKVPADVTYAVGINLLALVDMVPFGLDEIGVNSADGVLGQVIGRMATAKGSEHRLAAMTQTPAMGPQAQASGNPVVDFRPRAARRYDMAG